MASRASVLGLLWLSISGVATAATPAKTYSDSPAWPSKAQWDAFNQTLGGNLLVGLPPGHVCYPPYYDLVACLALPVNLADASWNRQDPTSIGTPWWAGGVCQPTLGGLPGPVGGCKQGNFPLYVVKALTAQHVSLGVKFAADHNLRLTIKNTGHDFIGRNIGFGSIEIWTHFLTGISFTDDWKPTVGPAPAQKQSAVTYGSAEVWGDVQSAGDAVGKAMVAGAEKTVGAGGGWIQGGGHGPLANAFGLGVDNVLEHEVVLANGTIVITNANSNADLFWALRGGGGATFGILTKVTVKTYPKPTMNGIMLTIAPATALPGDPNFLEAMTTWFSFFPNLTDFGLVGYPNLISNAYSGAFNAPNKDTASIQAFVNPILDAVRKAGGPTVLVVSVPLTDIPHLPPEPSRLSISIASRLVGPEGFSDRNRLKSVLQTLLSTKNGLIQAYPIAGGQVARNRNLDIGLNPAWRDAVVHFIIDTLQPTVLTDPIPAIQSAYTELGAKQLPALDTISVRSANYINEADPFEPNWQNSFFGSNYARLVQVKRKYDPQNLFWCSVCVGSEVFTQGPDGKLYPA